jgi:hypothetical protein
MLGVLVVVLVVIGVLVVLGNQAHLVFHQKSHALLYYTSMGKTLSIYLEDLRLDFPRILLFTTRFLSWS